MKLIWKYIVPILIVFAGIDVWNGDPAQPFSTLIPIVLGSYQKLVAVALVAIGIFVGVAVFITERERNQRK
jgi:hypothetical protein